MYEINRVCMEIYTIKRFFFVSTHEYYTIFILTVCLFLYGKVSACMTTDFICFQQIQTSFLHSFAEVVEGNENKNRISLTFLGLG